MRHNISLFCKNIFRENWNKYSGD